MRISAAMLLLALATGCANMSDASVKAELGFGSVLGKWLPRLLLEIEFKQEHQFVEDVRDEKDVSPLFKNF